MGNYHHYYYYYYYCESGKIAKNVLNVSAAIRMLRTVHHLVQKLAPMSKFL